MGSKDVGRAVEVGRVHHHRFPFPTRRKQSTAEEGNLGLEPTPEYTYSLRTCEEKFTCFTGRDSSFMVITGFSMGRTTAGGRKVNVLAEKSNNKDDVKAKKVLPTKDLITGKGLPKEALPTKSGYLPISGTSKSKLFYIFYEAAQLQVPLADTPWLLWLNGGPGCSSLIGCFYEIGPWWIMEDGSVLRNRGAWNRRCGIIFVDSPVGTGFSLAAIDDDIPKDKESVAKHLDYALNYFIHRNPIFRSRPLFLAGESYAGKYIPALAYHILVQPSPLRSQLVGLSIGNGFTDPRSQVQAHADVLWAFGLLDQRQSTCVRQMAKNIVDLVDREEWQEAYEKRTALCKWIEETAGLKTMLDIRRASRYHYLKDGTEYLAKYLNLTEVRLQLNVDGSALPWVGCRMSIRTIMAQDTMKSAKFMVEAILERGLAILLYQGMYDVKDGPQGSELWMRNLNWTDIKAFWKSERKVWKVNEVLAGYTRSLNNLMHVVVTGAGHQVPSDQPIVSQIMFESWMSANLKPVDKPHQQEAKL
ncbi:hypothetical protein GOP47_0029305 [Adiantum capillus-veneris]|nr:hypothetical protein GOP47_0029305 [Adiantum capillus-veneris]